MIRVSVLYPQQEGIQFDWTYYLEHHVPLVRRLLGGAMKSISIEQGVGGGAPESPAPYVAIADLTFESVAAYLAEFGPHAEEILADLSKFTSITPTVQVSEIRVEA